MNIVSCNYFRCKASRVAERSPLFFLQRVKVFAYILCCLAKFWIADLCFCVFMIFRILRYRHKYWYKHRYTYAIWFYNSLYKYNWNYDAIIHCKNWFTLTYFELVHVYHLNISIKLLNTNNFMSSVCKIFPFHVQYQTIQKVVICLWKY